MAIVILAILCAFLFILSIVVCRLLVLERNKAQQPTNTPVNSSSYNGGWTSNGLPKKRDLVHVESLTPPTERAHARPAFGTNE